MRESADRWKADENLVGESTSGTTCNVYLSLCVNHRRIDSASSYNSLSNALSSLSIVLKDDDMSRVWQKNLPDGTTFKTFLRKDPQSVKISSA